MEILRTNIPDDAFDIDLYYNLFEDEDRAPLKDAAGTDLEFENYAVYEDVNGAGELTTLLVLQDLSGECYVTNSRPFIQSFERIMDMGDRTGVTIRKVRVEERTGNNKRKFLHAKFIR